MGLTNFKTSEVFIRIKSVKKFSIYIGATNETKVWISYSCNALKP